MDYGFTEQDVLIIHHALRMRREYYERLQNSKENRRHIRETDAVIQKLEQDPMYRLLQHAKTSYRGT